MAVVYLDPEDEITGAVARLRAMPAGDVVLVVPAGSRVSTSRINFRLLAQESHKRDVRLAVVSDEPGVRSLATAAGVPAHATVDAAEAALAKEPRPAAVAGTAPTAAAATAAAVIPRAEPSPTPSTNLPTDDTKTQVLPAVGLPPAAAETAPDRRAPAAG